MRRSVIKSLIMGSLTVMLISMIIVSLVFFYNVKSDMVTETYVNMDKCMEHIKPLARMSVDYSASKMMNFFRTSMLQFSQLTNYSLIICETDGDVIWSDVDLSNSNFDKYFRKIYPQFSKNIRTRSDGVFDSVYKTHTITVGEVVKSETTANSWIVFCTAKQPNISNKYANVLLDVLFMGIASLAFMGIFLYLISNKITSPIEKINIAVKAFSKGDFSRRVEYKSDNELGELADNINAMADSIENLEKMRSDFVSDISHELRTPMTSISGFVEGLLDGTIPYDQSEKYLSIVLSESKRLSRLVNDLLNISRFEKGNIQIIKTGFDILELARIVLIKFESEITRKNISVDFDSETSECLVNADKDLYTQVLTNIVHNAVKFVDAGGSLRLKLETKKDKCVFSVENSGAGIAEDKLNFIWGRFYKTDDSRSSDRSGVGLGLYIVKRIIDAHGESIKVSSEPGVNTCFTFTAELLE